MSKSLLSSKYLKRMGKMYHKDEEIKEIVVFVVESPRDACMWSQFFGSLESSKYKFISKLPCDIDGLPENSTGCQAIRNLTKEKKDDIFGSNLIAIIDSDYRFILSTLYQIPFPSDTHIYETHIHSAENFYFHPFTLQNFFKSQNPLLPADIFIVINQLIEKLSNDIYEPLLAELFLTTSSENFDDIGSFSISNDFESCFNPLDNLNSKEIKTDIANQYLISKSLNLNNMQELKDTQDNLNLHQKKLLAEIDTSQNLECYELFKTNCMQLGISSEHAICFIQGHFYKKIISPIIQLLTTIFKKANENLYPDRLHAEINNSKSHISEQLLLHHIAYTDIPFFESTLIKIKKIYA